MSELAEGKDGVVWVSIQDGGFATGIPGTQTFTKFPQSPDRQNVLSLFASDDLVGAGYFKGVVDLIVSSRSGYRRSIPHNLVSVKVPCLPFTAIVGEQSGWVMAGTSYRSADKGQTLRKWSNSGMLIW